MSPIDLPDPATYADTETPALIERFARGVDTIDPRVAELTADQVDTAFLESAGVGKLPIRVVIGHIADADQVWLHRMRRTIAEDNPMLADWDHDAFINAGLYGLVAPEEGTEPRPAPPLGASLAAMHAVRQWGGAWLATLAPQDWSRRAMHRERGPVDLRTMLELNVWHADYHAVFIRAKIDHMLAS